MPTDSRGSAPGWHTIRAGAILGAVVMVALLFTLGAQPYAAGLFAPPWDKLAHFGAFGFISLLLHIGMHARRPLLAVIITAVIAVGDEVHQSVLPGRSAGFDDAAAGIAAALLAVTIARRIAAS